MNVLFLISSQWNDDYVVRDQLSQLATMDAVVVRGGPHRDGLAQGLAADNRQLSAMVAWDPEDPQRCDADAVARSHRVLAFLPDGATDLDGVISRCESAGLPIERIAPRAKR
jgi:hypothetical protein